MKLCTISLCKRWSMAALLCAACELGLDIAQLSLVLYITQVTLSLSTLHTGL